MVVILDLVASAFLKGSRTLTIILETSFMNVSLIFFETSELVSAAAVVVVEGCSQGDIELISLFCEIVQRLF